VTLALTTHSADRLTSNGPHLVALVRAGAVFRKGVLIARPEQDQEAAA
jgi:hypothetical protein